MKRVMLWALLVAVCPALSILAGAEERRGASAAAANNVMQPKEARVITKGTRPLQGSVALLLAHLGNVSSV